MESEFGNKQNFLFIELKVRFQVGDLTFSSFYTLKDTESGKENLNGKVMPETVCVNTAAICRGYRGNPTTSYSASTCFYLLTIYSFLKEINDDSRVVTHMIVIKFVYRYTDRTCKQIGTFVLAIFIKMFRIG